MGWSIGYDDTWQRDIGYGVPANCDAPGCTALIDRGLAYVCGGQPYGGEHGCGLYFCYAHLYFADADPDGAQLCERCTEGDEPYAPSPEHPIWIKHKLTHESWATWRAEHPAWVAAQQTTAAAAPAQGDAC